MKALTSQLSWQKCMKVEWACIKWPISAAQEPEQPEGLTSTQQKRTQLILSAFPSVCLKPQGWWGRGKRWCHGRAMLQFPSLLERANRMSRPGDTYSLHQQASRDITLWFSFLLTGNRIYNTQDSYYFKKAKAKTKQTSLWTKLRGFRQ